MPACYSRRSLLVRSAAFVAAAQTAGLTRLWGASPNTKPGVQLFMLADELKKDPAGTLAGLTAIGYGYVEAFGMGIQNMTEFKKMVADAGLACPCGHFGFGFEDTEKALDDAAALGVRYAISSVLPLAPPKNGDFRELFTKLNNLSADDFKRMAEFCNRIGESARKRGLEFAYHNHNIEFRRFDTGVTGYDILLKETDRALVKFEVDAGWMAAAGADPASILAVNAGRIPMLHFKDFSALAPPTTELGGDASKRIVDLGTGVAPLKAAFQAARKAGTEYFIVDHDPPFHNKTALEAAKVDFDYVAGLMAS